MPKKKIIVLSIFAAVILCVATLCVSVLIYKNSFPKISPDKVEKVVIWVDGPTKDKELNPQETDALIKMYNDSKYAGNGRGDGGTPQVQAIVYFTDGSVLRISEFRLIDRDIEVSLSNKNGIKKRWFYINNRELLDYLTSFRAPNEE